MRRRKREKSKQQLKLRRRKQKSELYLVGQQCWRKRRRRRRDRNLEKVAGGVNCGKMMEGAQKNQPLPREEATLRERDRERVIERAAAREETPKGEQRRRGRATVLLGCGERWQERRPGRGALQRRESRIRREVAW